MFVVDGVEMVGVRDAARLVGRTPETIRRWVWSGRLQATKQGNQLFIRRADLPITELGVPSETNLDLRGWAEVALSRPSATSGATAADLVLDDRAERAGR